MMPHMILKMRILYLVMGMVYAIAGWVVFVRWIVWGLAPSSWLTSLGVACGLFAMSLRLIDWSQGRP